MYLHTWPHNAMPADLRDAVSDSSNGAIDSLKSTDYGRKIKGAAPVPTEPVPTKNDTEPDYGEVYAALEAYSDLAWSASQDSREFLEASAAGQYLRARLNALGGANIAGQHQLQSAGRPGGHGAVSGRIRRELSAVLGIRGSGRQDGACGKSGLETAGVTIKPGYCSISYVKGNVPFLVQQDGFLKNGEVILTFDDGPGPLTGEISAAMREAGAPSVFFVLGANLGSAGKEHIAGAAADGHSVAVHGYYHATASGKPFTALSQEDTLRQLAGVANTVSAAAGVRPVFFRPPYGIIPADVLKAVGSELGLVPVGWTIDTLDWSTKDPDELFERTISLIKRRGKGIVLMHDIHPQSRTAAKRLVKWLAANGYKVVSPEKLAKAYSEKP